MRINSKQTKSLLTVKVQKTGSQTSNCYKPNGKNICFYPRTHIGYLDGGDSQTLQAHRPTHSAEASLSPPPAPDDLHVTRLLNSSFQFFQSSQKKPSEACWIYMSLTPSPHIAVCLPDTWVSAGNYTLKTNNTTESITQLIGPVTDDVLLAASSNLTCLLNTSSSNASYYNDTHSCTSWVPWNSTSNCTSPGIFLLCGTYAYSCLPPDPTGCILVFLAPGLIFINEGDMDQIVDHHEGLPTKPPHRGWWAIVAPILIGTGRAMALGAGIGDISTSAHFYYKLSQELNEDMEQVVESLVSVQRQINSLAAVALQNRRALDLITVEKRGTCLFLGEDCCYFVNETGIVQGKVKELRDRIEHRKKELQNFHNTQGLWPQFLPWLLPFLGTIMIIVILLLAGLCLVNLFQKFLKEWIQTISREQVKTILLTQIRATDPKSQKIPDDRLPIGCRPKMGGTPAAPTSQSTRLGHKGPKNLNTRWV
ncbi:syncytin-1-like [Moschus berezovskii]|uniref:syncytin-1-like n=1 Tax=Moschus berezovskii TaxID=68408 RepID=UPI002444C986|nr:syncytin-1-like [Moschus berezovskii]